MQVLSKTDHTIRSSDNKFFCRLRPVSSSLGFIRQSQPVSSSAKPVKISPNKDETGVSLQKNLSGLCKLELSSSVCVTAYESLGFCSADYSLISAKVDVFYNGGLTIDLFVFL